MIILFPAAAAAETADRDKPTQIEANRMSADDARRMTIFEGNVVLTRGTQSLRAERIVVRQDAEGFQLSTATGSLVQFKQKQDPKPPATEGIWMEGAARRVEIDDRNGKIEMFEDARVKRGGDEVAGAYIFVDQRSDFFTVRSSRGDGAGGAGGAGGTGSADKAAGKAQPEERVRAILQPKAVEKK